VLYADWRLTFWVIAALSLLLMPLAARIVGSSPAKRTTSRLGADRGALLLVYTPLLRNRGYLRFALSYALMFGALLMFVASAPVIVTLSMGLTIRAFAVLQICGVLAFMVGATVAMHRVTQWGPENLLRTGSGLQMLAGFIMTWLAWEDSFNHLELTALWALFCAGLGIRGPSTMAGALQAAGDDAGKGAGLTMFLSFAAVAGATMLVAPLLPLGLLWPAVLQTVMSVTSTMLLPESIRTWAVGKR
jgi:DHA1 family bicyclomycin/chloramphenicol resistance-like MFS transporter